MRQTAIHRERNVTFKRELKDAVKAFRAKPTSASLSLTQSMFDKAVKKNILKPNTSARRKAQLSLVAKTAGVKLATSAKKKAAAPAKTKAAPKKEAAKPPAKKAPAKKPVAKKSVAKAKK